MRIDPWMDIKTPAGARRAIRVGIGGCILGIGLILLTTLLTYWKVALLPELTPDVGILIVVWYGLLAWGMYRAFRVWVIVGVLVQLLALLLALGNSVAQGFKNGLPFGYLDLLQAAMLVQGARGAFYYQKLVKQRRVDAPIVAIAEMESADGHLDRPQNLRLHTLTQRLITTLDGGLTAFRSRDLSSELADPIQSGVKIQLGAVSMVEGREWVEATLPNGEICYMIGASLRSHAIPAEEEVKAD